MSITSKPERKLTHIKSKKRQLKIEARVWID